MDCEVEAQEAKSKSAIKIKKRKTIFFIVNFVNHFIVSACFCKLTIINGWILIHKGGMDKRATGLAVFCSITNQEKGYPFEVKITSKKITGVILSDQII
ncbi:hypothetical protein FACS1894140_0040 [Spirochaetia bacterium]|nr:hypothetical protein FACS1894140_0040 [Spirochaetia bacterium]